jgi:rare lipoprotein A
LFEEDFIYIALLPSQIKHIIFIVCHLLISVKLMAQVIPTPPDTINRYVKIGFASYYATSFQGRKTANGEIFNNNKLTAAHLTLPFGTLVKVTNIKTGKWVIVRINDRGPYNRKRIIDLSYRAAKHLGMINGKGIVKVKVEELPTRVPPQDGNDVIIESTP